MYKRENMKEKIDIAFVEGIDYHEMIGAKGIDDHGIMGEEKCKCCEKIKWWNQNKGKNDKLFSKIAVYGWREGERKVKGRQSFDYTTKAYELNYCPMCGRKLGE